jgi:hypothetical protein
MLIASLSCYGHTITNTPDPIRTRKLSVIGLDQYWVEGSPGNPQCRSVLLKQLALSGAYVRVLSPLGTYVSSGNLIGELIGDLIS